MPFTHTHAPSCRALGRFECVSQHGPNASSFKPVGQAREVIHIDDKTDAMGNNTSTPSFEIHVQETK